MARYVPCGGDDTDPPGRILATFNITEISTTASAVTSLSYWSDCKLPKAALVKLNSDTINNWSNAQFTAVVLHEIGHVLGIG